MFAIAFVFIVSVQSLHTTYAAVTKHPAENTRIQYPEPLNDANDDIPERCKDLTYCTIKPKDYPEEKFNNMFKDYSSPRRHRRATEEGSDTAQKSQANEAAKMNKPLHQPTMVIEINNRQGDPDDADNCESEVTYEPLYKVREKRDEPWRTVIQVPEKDFIQRVRLERCTNPGAPCFKVFSPSDEYVTYCKQKVNIWEVLVAKGDNGTETIKAELPVCCSCHYRQVDFETRIGKSRK